MGSYFKVRDSKTGIIYDNPWDLCEAMEDDLPYLANLFRPHEFVISDDGELSVVTTMNDIYPLPEERFKVEWPFRRVD